MRELTQDEISHVHEHGYVIARSILNAKELADIHAELEGYLPGWVGHCRCPDQSDLPPAGRAVPGFIEFPFTGATLNSVGTSPVLRRNAERILGQGPLFIEQSHLLAKYAGGPADVDQELHCDYANHTLLYPTARAEYGHVATILYYTDVTAANGPTGVVSTTVSDGRILWPDRYARQERPELYDAEEFVPCQPDRCWSTRCARSTVAHRSGDDPPVLPTLLTSAWPTGHGWASSAGRGSRTAPRGPGSCPPQRQTISPRSGCRRRATRIGTRRRSKGSGAGIPASICRPTEPPRGCEAPAGADRRAGRRDPRCRQVKLENVARHRRQLDELRRRFVTAA